MFDESMRRRPKKQPQGGSAGSAASAGAGTLHATSAAAGAAAGASVGAQAAGAQTATSKHPLGCPLDREELGRSAWNFVSGGEGRSDEPVPRHTLSSAAA